jgi:hypothetical protein
MVTFTVFFNTLSLLSNNARLLSNNACCTATFRTYSNTSILIGKQIVYQLTLADYQVIIQFEVEHLWLCDVPPASSPNLDQGLDLAMVLKIPSHVLVHPHHHHLCQLQSLVWKCHIGMCQRYNSLLSTLFPSYPTVIFNTASNSTMPNRGITIMLH